MPSESNVSFVEWNEHFVSKERGNRVVHYILKDSDGDSVLAVVGTERSLRHMVYVVADEFLDDYGAENQLQSGFKWRTRREVIDWLTSMLSKHKLQDSFGGDSAQPLGTSEFSFNGLTGRGVNLSNSVDRQVKRLKQPSSDIVWLGAAWLCGKQLKHYPAFCRNGTKVAIQSFVFVMAKEESRYLAYLEDMYEDKKGQKKIKVRWFHHSQEVKGVNRIRNAHPKEVFITPYTQVISAECVDGLAIILTREHFEKCMAGLPHTFMDKVHLCFRQFKSNKIKPFDLSKLRGYSNQPIISCLESDAIFNLDTVSGVLTEVEERALGVGINIKKGTKRTRNCGEHHKVLITNSDAPTSLGMKKILSYPALQEVKYNLPGRNLSFLKNLESRNPQRQLFKIDTKIELLSQDSGIRGCWFKCTVSEICRKHIKVQYDDVEDQDGCGNLEEWVPAFRLAALDKLGMRCPGRPRIRPSPPITDLADACYEVGSPVDAWWNDGWWEAVVTSLNNGMSKGGGDDKLQVYLPGENLFLDVFRKNLRVSRDWVGGKWADVKAKPDILSSISAVAGLETRVSAVSALVKDEKPNDIPLKADHTIRTESADLVESAPSGEGHVDISGDRCDIAMPGVLPTLSAVVGTEIEVFAAPNEEDNAPPKNKADTIENDKLGFTTLAPTDEGHVDLVGDGNQPSIQDNNNGGDSDGADDDSDDADDDSDDHGRQNKLDNEIAADENGAEPMEMAV